MKGRVSGNRKRLAAYVRFQYLQQQSWTVCPPDARSERLYRLWDDALWRRGFLSAHVWKQLAPAK